MTGRRVAIVGAGIAGLACADRLRAAKIEIVLFDKSRGVGGRLATRRGEDGWQADHGAQYFTAREPRFINAVESWCQTGLAAPWIGNIVSLTHGVIQPTETPTTRYVGVPTMTAPAKALAQGLPLISNDRIVALHRISGGWKLFGESGRAHEIFTDVVLALPALQAAELLRGCDQPLCERVDTVEMLPCWAVIARSTEPLAVDYVGAFVQDSPLSWIADNSSKPGRTTSPNTWVWHASNEWSRKHEEESPEQVLPALSAAFTDATGIELPSDTRLTAHRWRYAGPREALPERHLLSADDRIGVCGDWCGGPRVEGAWLSGDSLAAAMLSG